jgi:hypothetical protein
VFSVVGSVAHACALGLHRAAQRFAFKASPDRCVGRSRFPARALHQRGPFNDGVQALDGIGPVQLLAAV